MVAAAILFDLDGTVWDSHPCYAAALHSRLGLTSDAAVTRLRAGENVVAMARGCGLTDMSFSRLCMGSAGELRLYPNVIDTLRRLRRRGTRLAVVTNLPKWLAAPLLSESGVGPLLDSAVHAARKPSPDGINRAVRDLCPPDGDIYYVGDMPADGRAAARAGAMFAWASYGYCDARPVETDVALERFSDVLSL